MHLQEAHTERRRGSKQTGRDREGVGGEWGGKLGQGSVTSLRISNISESGAM